MLTTTPGKEPPIASSQRRYSRHDVVGMLRSAAAVAGVDVPEAAPLALRHLFQRDLIELGAQLLIGGTDDVGSTP